MIHELTDEDLERRLVAALDEVVPQLARDVSVDLSRAPGRPTTTSVLEVATHRRRDLRTARGRSLAAAASIVAVVALGATVLGGRSGTPGDAPSSEPAATAPAVVAFDPTTGSPITKALPYDVTPAVVRDGWSYYGWSGLQPISTDRPSASCPGCGTDRMILAADGPLFGGAILTAWTVDADIEPTATAHAVQVGAVTASSTDDGASGGRVTLFWPLAPGRTAYVDAYGLTTEQLTEMASSIDFSGATPTMAPPAGFHIIDAPRRANAQHYYGMMEDPAQWQTLQIYATNAGLQGMLDGQYLTSDMLLLGWTPRVVDGVTVAFDDQTADPASAGNASAIWVAGDWAYLVIGQRFTSPDEFATALAALHLTDPATFATATSTAMAADLDTRAQEERPSSGSEGIGGATPQG
jgi:hypothetical protein